MTIIGNGDIAWALRERDLDRDDLIFFAAGVSNSGETRDSEYQREISLLQEFQHQHIVYFSSFCLFYSKTRYAVHKFVVENYIKHWWSDWTILRLGNITWGNNNPHTLINYLRAHPEAPLRDEYRYICDLDEFAHWIRLIPDWNCEMNIPGRRMLVKDIYQEFVVNARERA